MQHVFIVCPSRRLLKYIETKVQGCRIHLYAGIWPYFRGALCDSPYKVDLTDNLHQFSASLSQHDT